MNNNLNAGVYTLEDKKRSEGNRLMFLFLIIMIISMTTTNIMMYGNRQMEIDVPATDFYYASIKN